MTVKQLPLIETGSKTLELGESPAKQKETCTAAPIGTGPDGKTCRTCKHKVRRASPAGNIFLKCYLMREHWTCGKATDIKAGWPSCRHYEEA